MHALKIDMEAALLACHRQHRAPGANIRDTMLGASEIGDCARRVVFNRLNNPTPTPGGAALMSMGQYLEPQAIDLIRAGAQGWQVCRTCQDPEGQFEACAKDAPLMSHPDGIITVGAGSPDGLLEGVGVLDIKRCYSHVVKAAKEGDIWNGYIDQIHTQIGTVAESLEAGKIGLPFAPSFGALFMICRDNPLLSHMEIIPADLSVYKVLKARARAILPFIQAGNLPDPEPKRGKCGTCAHKRECPATTGVDRPVTEGLSMADELEIESLIQKLSPIEAQLAQAKYAGARLIHETPFEGAAGKLVAFLHPQSTHGVLTEFCAKKN